MTAGAAQVAAVLPDRTRTPSGSGLPVQPQARQDPLYHRPLQGSKISTAEDRSGSACAGRAREPNAGKLTLKLRSRTADVRGRQRTTLS